MGDEMNIGNYGEISFTLRKKRKEPIDGDWYITTGFILHGTIADIDRNNVLPRKKDIRYFKECIKNQ